MTVVGVVSTRGAEANAAVGCGEGRGASSLSVIVWIGGSTGGPIPVADRPAIAAAALGDAGTGIGAGIGATIEAGSVRLIRSPEISSSRTASHAQRMSRAHSSTSGKRMRKWSSWTTSVSARTVVAKKARVSVDPTGVAVVEDGRVRERDGEGGTGRVEEEEEEGEGGG